MSTGSTGNTGGYINQTTPNLSILYTDAYLVPSQGNSIDYINISISYSIKNYRIWSFTFGGTVTSSVFTQVFTFGTDGCVPLATPGTGYCLPFGNISFSPPIQGTILLNQQVIPVNELNDGVVSYEWDPTTTVFQLTLNLCGYLDTSLPSNALYVTLSLKDSCCDCSVTGIVCDFCGICYTLGDYCQCQGSCCTAYQS